MQPAGRFGRDRRLRKKAEFEACRSQGRRYFSQRFVVISRKAAGQASRLGLVVTRETGGAVVRNRWKRVIRDAFRREGGRLLGPGDHIVMVRRSVKGPPTAAAREELKGLWARSGRA